MFEALLKVNRHSHRFVSDDRRVISRFFCPGEEGRISAIIGRVLNLSEGQVSDLLASVLDQFSSRHRNISAVLEDHYRQIKRHVECDKDISPQRRQLIGAYFTMEYAIESAALFNPSIVPAPNQEGVTPGDTRFLMSLRATGEGHLSSIVFRGGVIHRDGEIEFDPVSPYASRLRVVEDRLYNKHTFWIKLLEMGAYNPMAEMVTIRLHDQFTFHQLNEAIEQVRAALNDPAPLQEVADSMVWLARSNYHLEVPVGTDPSEIVIFPTADDESHGIEDVRLVRFVDEDGSVCYYGTYTAFNGFHILPMLIETTDFQSIKIHTLNGRYVQNKGLALFPRKVDGWYLMISRLDGENLYLMKSDNIRFWNEAQIMQSPRFPWEFVQIGNNGSPLETEAGWLLLTHGVGPMRQYCIGASLLDRDDPSKVIGQLEQPLLVPTEAERDGYVPNVVYSCGAMIHNDTLVIPYAMSDTATSFATVRVGDLLDTLKR